MRVLSLSASIVFGAAFVGAAGLPHLYAQQSEPGTESTQVAPGDTAPKAEQAPNLRVNSMPHTDLSASTDSAPTPMDLGLGVSAAPDLGHDVLPPTPMGMLASAEPDNPRNLYYSLPYLSMDQISAGDRQIIEARQADLDHAAGFRGLHGNRADWTYRQTVCPAMQPDAADMDGISAGADGQGFILLQYFRGEQQGHSAAFVAIVPRSTSLPVQVISVPSFKASRKPKPREVLKKKSSREAVNEAIPPEELHASLQPIEGWIAVSACIAELGGAAPRIPDEPDLGQNIVTAPSPMLKLHLDGSREVIFTDRVDEGRYVIWDASIRPHGQMAGAEKLVLPVLPLVIQNPPVPQPHLMANLPDPPMHIIPPPPSPISGDHQ
jgi:hypothetical protein